ncbi:MAG: DUF3325 domain-containing protein [Opitutaceae bacterium]|nr:DUF3325 domain-containing protein [Opitutaceae bacterium]
MNLAALLLTYAGLLALALTRSPYRRAVLPREPAPTLVRLLPPCGWLLLVVSACLLGSNLGWPLGLVTWCADIAGGGFALIMLLAWHPRLTPLPLALAAGLLL